MNRLLKPLNQDQSGVIMVGALIVTFFFLVVSLAVAEMSVGHYNSTRRTLIAANAINVADAGGDAFMNQINLNSNYQGTNNAPNGTTNSCSGYTMTPVTLINNKVQGKQTYESCVQNGTLSNERVVTITGKVYLPQTASTPISTRKIRLVVQSSATGASYTVETGNGGLTLSNSADVGSGDFFINGRLLMSNSAKVGDSTGTKSSRLWVAGLGCGSGASYPQVCSGATGQSDLPIFISNNAHIYADVHSPNMTGGGTDGSSTRSKMTNSGLVDSNAAVVAMPPDNRSTVMGRNTWTTKSANTANCSSGNTITWAAGTHFTGGNITIDHSCVVTVNGDIWIDGGLTLSSSASLKVGNGLTTPPNIMIDGVQGFQPINNTSMTANATGVTFEVKTFYSTAGACSTTCPVPTGMALYNSQNTVTIQFSNAFTAPGASFYSVYSGLKVNNGTNIGQLIGQKIELANAGTITFSGGTITSGTPTTWDVKHYEQIY
jgi:hypothetical protein